MNALSVFSSVILRKRVVRGKEHTTRWRERLSVTDMVRPNGKLVWVHAVGLGEMRSTLGIISEISKICPDVSFLLTTQTRVAQEVLARHQPKNVIHQFIPYDVARYRRKFLKHWQPDMVWWFDQDIWPGWGYDLALAKIPQIWLNARLSPSSQKRQQKLRALYVHSFAQMQHIFTADPSTYVYLQSLGLDVIKTPSLKLLSRKTEYNEEEYQVLREYLKTRLVWSVCPAHPIDIELAMDAHLQIVARAPDALLIIVPRDLASVSNISEAIYRSSGQMPSKNIWVFDSFGDVGLAYKLSKFALIGGSFSEVQGHNPWEAILHQTAILNGPNTLNFDHDYSELQSQKAAIEVSNPMDIVSLCDADFAPYIKAALQCHKSLCLQHDVTVAMIAKILKAS